MRVQSCINRYARYFFVSLFCSSLTLFINSDMLVNRLGLQLVSTAVFMIFIMVDSYIFSSYFGKNMHIKFGIIYPYAGFVVTSYICHFLITTSRFKYLFLPFCIFTQYNVSRFVSLTLVHLIFSGLMALCLYMGKKKFYKNL